MVCPPLISFLDETQRDIGQQRGEDPALWCTAVAACELSFRQDASLQERPDQSVEFVVADAATDSVHQVMVVDVIKAALDVAFNGPLEGRSFDVLPAFHIARE